MVTNRFGNTGMIVSRVAVGAMTFAAKMDLQAATRVVDEALEHGVNFIDTADGYAQGAGERMVGEVIKGKRDKLFLATKIHTRHSHGDNIGRTSRNNIINGIEKSLRQLQTDHVDLYQLHHPDPQTPIDETLTTMDVLIKAGKVRYIGCSNHYAWQIAYTNGIAAQRRLDPFVSVQSSYNLLDRTQENELVPFIQKFNIALVVYAPLAAGLLTDRYDRQNLPPEKSRTRTYRERANIEMRPDDLLESLKSLARQNEVSINQLAIQWLLAKPYVTTVLLGGSKPEHFSVMYDIVDKPLNAEVVAKIDELSAGNRYKVFQNQRNIDGPGVARA